MDRFAALVVDLVSVLEQGEHGVAVLLLQVEGEQLGVSPQEPLPAQRTHRVPLWGDGEKYLIGGGKNIYPTRHRCRAAGTPAGPGAGDGGGQDARTGARAGNEHLNEIVFTLNRVIQG